MTLDELIEQVVDDRVTLNSVLLKAKVLAYNLHADNLKVWLEEEINGYNSDSDVVMPEYRTNISVHSVGTFVYGSSVTVNNHLIPLNLLPKDLKAFAERTNIFLSITSIQEFIEHYSGGVEAPWPSDMVARLNYELKQTGQRGGYLAARSEIGRASLQAILDNTRNRLLTFLMELREQYPDLDISKSTSDADKRQTAQVLVTNHIYGNENIVASGREFTQSVTKSIKDLDSLLSRLQDLGVKQKDLETLEQAVTNDQQTGQHGIGSNVRGWLGNFTAGVASSHVATNLPQIVEAIGTFLGQ